MLVETLPLSERLSLILDCRMFIVFGEPPWLFSGPSRRTILHRGHYVVNNYRANEEQNLAIIETRGNATQTVPIYRQLLRQKAPKQFLFA